jgi:type II secretory pathway component PulK
MALIFVLWTLVLVGLAVGELVARARTEARMVASIKARAVARYAAESGMLVTATSLELIVDSAREPVALAERVRHLDTLGRMPAEFAGGASQFRAQVLNLNARLDLARSDTTVLVALLSQFVAPARARAIVAELRDAPVTRFGELARLPDVGDALALTLAPYVTVSGDGLVDVNAAPAAVLASLPGVGAGKAAALIARRDAGEVFTSVDAFRPPVGSAGAVSVNGILMTIAPSRLMIVSRGWQRGDPLTHEIQAVYGVLGGRLRLESWEERDR